MQRREAKGFFFNTVFKRPIILRTLLRGSARQPGGDNLGEGEMRDANPSPGTPFRRVDRDAREGGEVLKKISAF
ncbi:hypothetical protein [Candidatus Solincola tengchongensis]|uniref:hypothetical protein n=1 Tax=Candidatus Solincola tengchongensis TaxID=2900693 RepID=UPI00257CA68B|nr:hypothetical protein [Candidatus Solincola tengchongensis]